MKFGSIICLLFLLAQPAIAAEAEQTMMPSPPSGWFLDSQSRSAEQFDLWQIDSGYTYALSPSTQLYVSTRLKSGNQYQSASRGLLSGVQYNFSPKISLRSAFTSERIEEDTRLGVELSSQYELNNRLNLHATMDYESLEQVYQLGIGFRF
ncbi:hypothetical protein L4174_013505 [Photobacterium sp. CCB-ST2H9]|uniref:hypothetical protein n=1 Tax=Photobacterium sp. CCB-ST2H9 TaxID=2912855 RepID=UPI0020065DE9|nr:hypothetical protein [Photobacterium sp. CCB-ST2H9]UTM56818.1 hypothetical protein L4174_013505 [Photobacterium sp. CCB-ST2H9]